MSAQATRRPAWMDQTGVTKVAKDGFDNDDNSANAFNTAVNRFNLYTALGITWKGCVEARNHVTGAGGLYYDTSDLHTHFGHHRQPVHASIRARSGPRRSQRLSQRSPFGLHQPRPGQLVHDVDQDRLQQERQQQPEQLRDRQLHRRPSARPRPRRTRTATTCRPPLPPSLPRSTDSPRQCTDNYTACGQVRHPAATPTPTRAPAPTRFPIGSCMSAFASM